MRFSLLVVFLIIPFSLSWGQDPCLGGAPFRILHFTKTSEGSFDHNTRNNSRAMFEAIGAANNFTVTDTDQSDIFDQVSNLLPYTVIVFSNTTGSDLLNTTQRAALEAYIAQGGSFIGIHAATDAYRNPSTWPFYNNLVGGIVQSGPSHTSDANYRGTMTHDVPGHPLLEGIEDPWNKEDEYYYWSEDRGGQISPGITSLLTVAKTGDMVFDSARAITWFRQLTGGGRSFYTALGHNNGDYTDASNSFRTLLRNAVCWTSTNSLLLPIQLLSFTARSVEQGNQVDLWISNEGVEELHLEKSRDGAEFQNIRAFRLHEGENKLTYLDQEAVASGDYYYRFSWQEVDGAVAFSPVQVVRIKGSPSLGALTPNPVTHHLRFVPNTAHVGKRYMIRDILGRRIHSGWLDTELVLSTDSWTQGTYLIQVEGQTGQSMMFLVQH
ncbi:MAG: ThuA domain-containing protein [Saprospiraceae bacterium]|nr:ThuA domain-containing protein [Saprospiraceae bacterium]